MAIFIEGGSFLPLSCRLALRWRRARQRASAAISNLTTRCPWENPPDATCERRRLVEGAVLVVQVGGAVARAEGGRRSQHQLLFDEAGFGMVLGQLAQTVVQRVPEQVQPLGRLAETRLGLRGRTRQRFCLLGNREGDPAATKDDVHARTSDRAFLSWTLLALSSRSTFLAPSATACSTR